MLKQVKALQKIVTIRKRSDMLKYDSFQQIFNSMHKGHKDTRKAVEELERRVSQLEHVMGVDNPMTIGDITPA